MLVEVIPTEFRIRRNSGFSIFIARQKHFHYATTTMADRLRIKLITDIRYMKQY